MTTKERIIKGAREVFQRHGFAGTKMQVIADTCGVNKALLHYHFGTKQELFHAILQQSFAELMPVVFQVLNADTPLKQKLKNFVSLYLENIIKNPELPLFVITELQRNPSFIKKRLKQQRSFPPLIEQQVREAVERGEMIRAEPADIKADLLGLCIFPFIARPIIQHLSGKSNDEYKQFLLERSKHVSELLVNGLFSSKSKWQWAP